MNIFSTLRKQVGLIHLINQRKLFVRPCTCRSAADITIRVGDHDWENPTPALMELDVELYIMHENYDETGGIENDIAVIKVRKFWGNSAKDKQPSIEFSIFCSRILDSQNNCPC